MKIRLDAQSGVSILLVSGPIAAAELDVLKAGVTKLLAEGKFPLKVDLTHAEIPAELASRVQLLTEEARLLSAVAVATAEKARLIRALDDTAALGAEIKKLRRDNGEMRVISILLKSQIEAQVKNRKPPFVSETIQDSLDEVYAVIHRVFASSGLFQEKVG